MFAVTLVQFFPPSRVTCTRPSSVPTQTTFGSVGASEMERMVSYDSAPLMSSWIGPPLSCCLLLSLRVRSPLTAAQCSPPSVDRSRTLAPM